ncbi:hypothetical protein E3N88_31982 [Mikania micrantha]|uniref:Uncharacterized protein n=1 Tax=Mikania micrantha TaxID=192012 RepID=A0A5N6M7W0_9ASTR|nr:hypothetical protein E3N88_31982 [Mikania micrantha]
MSVSPALPIKTTSVEGGYNRTLFTSSEKRLELGGVAVASHTDVCVWGWRTKRSTQKKGITTVTPPYTASRTSGFVGSNLTTTTMVVFEDYTTEFVKRMLKAVHFSVALERLHHDAIAVEAPPNPPDGPSWLESKTCQPNVQGKNRAGNFNIAT